MSRPNLFWNQNSSRRLEEEELEVGEVLLVPWKNPGLGFWTELARVCGVGFGSNEGYGVKTKETWDGNHGIFARGTRKGKGQNFAIILIFKKIY